MLRAGIRYIGVDGTERAQATPSAAGSPPYIILPSARRSLLQQQSSLSTSTKSERTAAARRTIAQASAMPYSRKLLQSVATSSDLLWLDLNGDGAVTTADSDAFYCMRSTFPSARSGNDGNVCTLLDALYSPSTAPASSLLDETLDDSSFVSTSSDTWQAVDPRLLYLRGDEPFAFAAGAACASLPASQSVPQLRRFDDTRPPTRREFDYLVADTSEQYDELMRPSNPDFFVYQVRAACTCRSACPLMLACPCARLCCNLAFRSHVVCASLSERPWKRVFAGGGCWQHSVPVWH